MTTRIKKMKKVTSDIITTSFTSTKATCYVQRKHIVHIDTNTSFTSTGCERNSRATEHVQPNAYLFEGNLRTLKNRQPFEIKRHSGFQNGLMFQPQSESTSFTSMGERSSPPAVRDEGERSSNEQRHPASVSATGCLL